jgi:hypothetical protein
MEQILTNLLVPDSDVIKRATEDLKAAFKLDDAIPQVHFIYIPFLSLNTF